MHQMNAFVRKPKDLILGAVFLLISLLVISIAAGYEMGTSRQMGPGYLPLILGGCLSLIGLILIGGSLFGPVVTHDAFMLRPAAFVLGATLMFAVLIRPLGLLLTVLLVVLPAALASSRNQILPVLALALALSIGTTLLFPLALGQQVPVLGYMFAR
ncbi:MAG: tripartite tricarboxylate transporter TctB family protein [Bacteroidota bacterium]